MSEWETSTIGTLCDVGGGEVKTGPFGSQLHQSDYQDTGTPVVMPKDIVNGKIDESSIARVSESHVERLSRHKLALKDIVYGRRGDIGRQALITTQNVGWLCGTGCLRITLGNAPVDNQFLHYYLRLPSVISWIKNQAIGATMPNLNTKILRSVLVHFPKDIYHQKKIAAILSAYDDLIENNNRRIALLEQMAEEIYREWFVRMRFPGYEQATFHQGVPEGWEMVKVSKAFDFTGGGTPSKKEARYWEEGDINWFTPTDITSSDGIMISNSGVKCTNEGLNNSSAKMFPSYSVMMTSRATIGAIGINTNPACTNQGFITCIPNKTYPLSYLYHWLKINKPYFEILATGATFAELTKGTFKKISILTPPKGITNQFVRLISPFFKSIEARLSKTNTLKQTRDRLLSRLISGKLSVEELDIQFPPSMEEMEEARESGRLRGEALKPLLQASPTHQPCVP